MRAASPSASTSSSRGWTPCPASPPSTGSWPATAPPASNGPSVPARPTTRFARSRTCELWQLDAFEVALTGGDRATVYQIIDDASRLCIALTARTRAANPADAIDVLARAIAAHGRPVAVLTDNGAAPDTHRRGLPSSTELYLASLGVAPISGSPRTPPDPGQDRTLPPPRPQMARGAPRHHPHRPSDRPERAFATSTTITAPTRRSAPYAPRPRPGRG